MGYLLAFMSALCFSITNIVLKKGMSHSKDNGVWFITLVNMLVLGTFLLIYELIVSDIVSFNIFGVLLFAAAGILIRFGSRLI